MTHDEAVQKARQIADLNDELQTYLYDRFVGARGPVERDYCFGYSIGMATASCCTIRAAVPHIRVALNQIKPKDQNT